MKDKKTLRDELAMSMPFESIPKIEGHEAMDSVSKKYNIGYNLDDVMSMIDFALKYQAIIRYEFADKMLETR